MAARQWTESQKQRQRELIQTWQPWQQSTGAITIEGKAISKMNALKSGEYTAAAIQSHREIRALFREIEAQFKNSK